MTLTTTLIARSLTKETKADTTNGPQRPKPSDIHLVYSIYGIVSEHTPEEWEVIREYQRKGRTWEEWMMGGERKRMDAAGFKTSFRKLEEDVPPAKVLPTPTVSSPPPAVPAVSNPILTPLDANNELMVSRDDLDLDITDTILGIIGGTRGDYIDESFNFLYGVGDNMSLGLGWWLRSTFFYDQADYGGSSYYIGGWVGFAGDLLMGVGAFKALGKTFGREALESGLRNAPRSGEWVSDAMKGFRNGEIIPDSVLERLSSRLRNNTRIIKNEWAQKILDKTGDAAQFMRFKDGSAAILLRPNATRYQLVHELKHYEHWLADPVKYAKMGKLEREEFVFRALQESNHWRLFTDAERSHALELIKYYRKLYGN